MLDVQLVRDPYATQQSNLPRSYPQRELTVVPLEWIEAHPRYRWCLTSDVTHLVDHPTAQNAVYVLKATWDHFEQAVGQRRKLAHSPIVKPKEDIWDGRLSDVAVPIRNGGQ